MKVVRSRVSDDRWLGLEICGMDRHAAVTQAAIENMSDRSCGDREREGILT